MTASWSGPRWGQPNTRSRRDPSRAWRAPLGSLLFAVLDVTDGGSRTVPLPSQPQPHPPSSRRATPLPLAPRAPTARSLTPCSAPSRRGLATPTTPDPRRDGQPRPRRRAASSQSCRSGQRNGAQVEQRNNLGPHYKSPLTGNRPIQAITFCPRPLRDDGIIRRGSSRSACKSPTRRFAICDTRAPVTAAVSTNSPSSLLILKATVIMSRMTWSERMTLRA